MSDFTARLDEALEDLVDAAIEADMYERDYWAQTGAEVFYNHALFKKIVRGNPGANDLGHDEDDTTDYEAEVFNFWPGQIDQIFDVWRNVPDPEAFQGDVDKLVALAAANDLEPKIEPPRNLESGDFPDLPDTRFGGDLRLITTRAGDLYGRWAEAFHDSYVVPLPWVLANQQALIAILAAGVRSEQEIWRHTQEAIIEVATAGATWFRSIKNTESAAETVFTVGQALNDGFSAVKDGISLNPFDIIGAVGDLGKAGTDLVGAIEAGEPSTQEGSTPASVASAYTRVAQTVEYTLNKQIVEAEELLEKVLAAGVSALNGSPATFVMGDNHLDKVRNGDAILDRGEVNIHRPTVNRLVAALARTGEAVSRAGGRIDTSAHPWIRPGSIGMGAEGPYRTLLALQNLVAEAMYDTGRNLAHVSQAVSLAADYAYAADEDARAELDRLDDRLDRAQDRWADEPQDAVPDVVEPYVIPPGELYVDQEDCLPDGTPLFPEQPAGPLAPSQP